MIVSIILFIIIFCVIVVAHEFGHFIVAKSNGIHVVEFFVGMGPTLVSFTKGDTKYSIKLLPLGGACVFEGEDGLNTKEGEVSEGAFPNAPVWTRFATVLAGPVFNFLLPIPESCFRPLRPFRREVMPKQPGLRWETGLSG